MKQSKDNLNESKEIFKIDTIKSKNFDNVNKLISQSNDFMNSFHDNLNDSFRSVKSLKNLNFDSIKLHQEYESLKVKYNVLKKKYDQNISDKSKDNTELYKRQINKLNSENQSLMQHIKANQD